MIFEFRIHQILYYLQSLLTKTSLSDLSFSSYCLSPLYQIFLYETHMSLWLYQFSNKFQTELASKRVYKVSIDKICLRITQLQVNNKQAKEIRVKIKEGWKDVNEILYFQTLSYVLEIIYIELISQDHKYLFTSYFSIKNS